MTDGQATIFSFFSGAGFLDLGFETAGFNVAYVNEVFEPFMDAYQHARRCLHLPAPQYGYYLGSAIDFLEGQQKDDLRRLVQTVRGDEKLIGFIGGSPCPDFSVGGKNRGKEGDHGKLSSTYIDIVCQQQPDFFLFENVEGLWKTKKHRIFYEEIKKRLHEAGYITTERLINAIEYGAPQDRNRIILIGFQKELLIKAGITLEGAELSPGIFPWEKYIVYPRSKVFNFPWIDRNPFQEDSALPPPKGICEELTVEHWFRKNDVTNHPNAKHHFKPRQGMARFETVQEGDDSRKSFKRLHRWRYSPTVCYGNNEVHLHPYKKRRISVAEALALQSLPREFAFPEHLSLTNMFKAIGNGVPFLAARSLALSILDFVRILVGDSKMKLTASNIVSAIGQLPKDTAYQYINPRNKTQIQITHITYPAGPIIIKRYNPSKGEVPSEGKEDSISTQMIWRIANAFLPNQPINFDRVLGGSYNTRSVLETLLAHTPQFYYCYPGRIEFVNSSSQIRRGHKHLIWMPDQPHELGIIGETETEVVISEVPNNDIIYDALTVPDDLLSGELDINVKRRHAQMQIALIDIGYQLGYKTWIAQNDKGIIYRNKKLGEMDGVIPSLQSSGTLIAGLNDAFRAALLIDCIWFRNARLMPAVIEVEHSTGVTSGLTRMKGLQDLIPAIQTRYVIVAPDEDREKVIREANRPQFRSLNAKFFPYSSVEELYALCQRRKIRDVGDGFLDCYMEPVVEAA